MEYFIFIILATVALAVYNGFDLQNKLKQKKNDAKETEFRLRRISAFSPTHVFVGPNAFEGVAVDPSRNMVAFSDMQRRLRTYNFKDIISVETIVDGESVQKTNRGSQLVGAAVGGLLLGGAGLLIGALSGSKSEKKKVSKISIKVVVSNIDKPGHSVVFYDDAINVKQAHETDLRSSAARADEWTQRFQVIIGTDNAP